MFNTWSLDPWQNCLGRIKGCGLDGGGDMSSLSSEASLCGWVPLPISFSFSMTPTWWRCEPSAVSALSSRTLTLWNLKPKWNTFFDKLPWSWHHITALQKSLRHMLQPSKQGRTRKHRETSLHQNFPPHPTDFPYASVNYASPRKPNPKERRLFRLYLYMLVWYAVHFTDEG